MLEKSIVYLPLLSHVLIGVLKIYVFVFNISFLLICLLLMYFSVLLRLNKYVVTKFVELFVLYVTYCLQKKRHKKKILPKPFGV